MHGIGETWCERGEVRYWRIFHRCEGGCGWSKMKRSQESQVWRMWKQDEEILGKPIATN